MFVQGDYQINQDWSVQGYRYQYMDNKIDDFVAYSVQKNIASGKVCLLMQCRVAAIDYSVSLLILGHQLNEESQLWANFSQGFELADPAKYYGQGSYEAVDASRALRTQRQHQRSRFKMSALKRTATKLVIA